MTLDDLLALLPDNEDGEITAADLRTIVSELWLLASMMGQAFAYQWTDNVPPNQSGKVTLDQGWSSSSTTALVSETTSDGETLTFSFLDENGGYLWITSGGGAQLRAVVTGPTVDQGNYREVPIQIDSLVGSSPANNTKLTLGLMVEMQTSTGTPT